MQENTIYLKARRNPILYGLILSSLPSLVFVLLALNTEKSGSEILKYIVGAVCASFFLMYAVVISITEKIISNNETYEIIESGKATEVLSMVVLILCFIVNAVLPLIAELTLSTYFLLFMCPVLLVARDKIMIGKQYAIIGSIFIDKQNIEGILLTETQNKAIPVSFVFKNSRERKLLLSKEQIRKLTHNGLNVIVQ